MKVTTSGTQLEQLLVWAERFEKRTWAVEAAGGWGYLVSQQLAEAGEEVLDVPATLAARVRLLGTGRSNKNDPNDARSVAIAAMRAPNLAGVERSDHTGVLRLLAKRNLDLGRSRNRTANRLHALLAELVAAGSPVKSTLLARNVFSTPSRRARRSKQPARASPSSILTIYAASTTRCASPRPASRLPSPPAPRG